MRPQSTALRRRRKYWQGFRDNDSQPDPRFTSLPSSPCHPFARAFLPDLLWVAGWPYVLETWYNLLSDMSGVEVIGCVAAVVSAFHGAAELIQIVKERKEKKKKRRAQEVEQIVQQQLLHSSLVQGERDCENCRIQGQQRFGAAFERGDDIAVSQLKDVVIHLQGEVIRSLQIALQVETAVLNVPQLHEAAILDRTQAVGSMQALCQRIMMRMPPQRQMVGDYAQFMLGSSGLGGGLNVPTGLQRTLSGASA